MCWLSANTSCRIKHNISRVKFELHGTCSYQWMEVKVLLKVSTWIIIRSFVTPDSQKILDNLQFRCRGDNYPQIFAITITKQPLKWWGIFYNNFPIVTRNADAYKVRWVYSDAMVPDCPTSSRDSSVGEVELMMLCNETSDTSTSTSESLLSSGSLSTRI